MEDEIGQLAQALEGDPAAVRELVDELTPVIQARVARVLLRRAGGARGRDVRQEIEDMTQDVFVALFRDGAKLLRAWDPERGMGLKGFVGLISEQQVAQVLRSRRRSPWTEDPTESSEIPADRSTHSVEAEVASKQLLERTLDDVRADLSPKGAALFELLLVEERSVDEVCETMEMKRDAVYAWRSRLGKRLSAAWQKLKGRPQP